MDYLVAMIKKFISKIRERYSLFIIADAADNSITFSEELYRKLRRKLFSGAKVFVFYIPDEGLYGFTLKKDMEPETQLAEVMYNTKYKTIGFNCLIPTVNRIFYDYGLAPDISCKLSVRRRVTKEGSVTYYQILRNNGTVSK